MSAVYSFSDVDVFLLIDPVSDYVTLPFGLTAGVPVLLTKKNFFGKDGAIEITPNPEAIASPESSIEGDQLWDISNDLSGSAKIRVGDFSSAHILLTTVYTFHQLGFLVGNIGLIVNQRVYGGLVSNSVSTIGSLSSLLYTCTKGSVKGVPNKSWGATQNGNEFTLQFESVTGGMSLGGGLVGELTSLFT